jgi:hypothetical protein
MNKETFNWEINQGKPETKQLEVVLTELEESIKDIKSQISSLRKKGGNLLEIEKLEENLGQKEVQKKKITWELVKDSPVFKN